MAEESVTRKLAAILCTDVAGYSRLTGGDEEGTHRNLSHCLDVITGIVEGHGGRVLHYAGDAVLAEFASAVVAVSCAVDIQRDLADRNRDLPEARRLRFRIGINLGDVIVDRDELYGDGVNVAARLESLAEPGGICIARNVFHEVRDKVDAGFEFVGEQAVKNIERPIAVYRVLTDPAAVGKVIAEPRSRPRLRTPMTVAVGLAVLAVAVGIGVWRPWEQAAPAETARNSVQTDSGKPSVAVLPFTNMSDNKAQDYFSDGMAEDIITDLSKISGLFVISRNSSFAYKGQSPDIRAVGRELGVRYVVEGSVRRAGGRVRITVQLTDAESGGHVWAERYDRKQKGIFDLQDEVRGKVVSALRVKLTPGEKTRLARRLTNNADAYDLWLRGRRQESYSTKAANLESRRLYERAIELDPKFAAAHASLSVAYYLAPTLGWRESREAFFEKGLQLAKKAVALDGDLPLAHWALARARANSEAFDGARVLASLEKAISLDPNYADAFGLLASHKNNIGRAEEALAHIEQAMRLNPRSPWWYFLMLGKSQFMMTRYEAAVESLKKGLQRNPKIPWLRHYLIAAYGQLGKIEDAEWEREELRAQGQDIFLSRIRAHSNVQDPAYRERYIEGLRKAGVPE